MFSEDVQSLPPRRSRGTGFGDRHGLQANLRIALNCQCTALTGLTTQDLTITKRGRALAVYPHRPAPVPTHIVDPEYRGIKFATCNTYCATTAATGLTMLDVYVMQTQTAFAQPDSASGLRVTALHKEVLKQNLALRTEIHLNHPPRTFRHNASEVSSPTNHDRTMEMKGPLESAWWKLDGSPGATLGDKGFKTLARVIGKSMRNVSFGH